MLRLLALLKGKWCEGPCVLFVLCGRKEPSRVSSCVPVEAVPHSVLSLFRIPCCTPSKGVGGLECDRWTDMEHGVGGDCLFHTVRYITRDSTFHTVGYLNEGPHTPHCVLSNGGTSYSILYTTQLGVILRACQNFRRARFPCTPLF